MDVKHRLFGDHGLDHTESAVPDTVSIVHHTMRDLRLGLQDTGQHGSIGKLFATDHHRLDRLDKIMDSVESKISQKFISLGDDTMIICDWRWWVDNEEMINSWMDANITNGRRARNGMIIDFDSQDDFLLFLLTWQGPKES